MNKVQLNLDKLLEAKKGKKKLNSKVEIELAIVQLFKKHRVDDFFSVKVLEHIQKIPVRKYGNRPAGVKERFGFSLEIQINQDALDKYRQNLGWRVYATNSPKDRLSTKEAIICYRQESKVTYQMNLVIKTVQA